jgi:hypothetical protein
MLYGSVTRPTHRTTPAGTGQHRQPTAWATVPLPPARRSAAEPAGHRTPLFTARRTPRLAGRRQLREPERGPQRLMSGLAAAIVLSICGLVTFFIVADERRVHAEPAAATPIPWAISSRDVDPEPLSLTEVFPGTDIRLLSGSEPYRVTMTHIDTDCDTATTGALGELLDAHGCSQVVRAALTAPYGGYQVTAGIFNLADEAGAARVGEQVRELVETGAGSFAAMAAGAMPGVRPQSVPDSQVGWHEQGHFLIYCVITRPDARPVPDADRYAERITAELIDEYLGEQKIGARAAAAT